MSGRAHVAASTDRIFHLTNAEGSWQRDLVAAATDGGAFGEPSIATDADGSLAIAFTRFSPESELGRFPEAVLLTRHGSGGWSSPLTVREVAWGPALALRAGVHLAYSEGWHGDVACEEELALHYATGPFDSLTDEVASPAADRAFIAIAQDGTPRLLFIDSCRFLAGDGLWYSDGSNNFLAETVPGTKDGDVPTGFAIDSSDVAHITFTRWNDTRATDDLYYTSGSAAGWGDPVTPMTSLRTGALAIDSRGAVHIVGAADDGIVYVTNRSGAFISEYLWRSSDSGRVVIAVDGSDRPHVVFATDSGLWYSVGQGY